MPALTDPSPRQIPQLPQVSISGSLADGTPDLSVPLRHACKVVRQMTGEMLSFTGERVQIRRDRRRAQCHIRQIAMYVCHVSLRIPQTDIALAFGRDRTTVGHACAVVEDRRDNVAYDEFVAAVERLATSVFQASPVAFHE
nr:helix-turn-helix domain-containing protein [uncultured Gellertiella sp.]